jgi:hypothetical protein
MEEEKGDERREMKEGGKPGDGRYKTRKTKRRKIVG